jgi:hypothetical protein
MKTESLTTDFVFDEAWFEKLANLSESHSDEYRSLGVVFLHVAIEIVKNTDSDIYGLIFDGYDVKSAGRLDNIESFNPDIIIRGSLLTWRDMVNNIIKNGKADRYHTLNTLTIADTPLSVIGDAMGRDKFFRYAQSLQALFDFLGER